MTSKKVDDSNQPNVIIFLNDKNPKSLDSAAFLVQCWFEALRSVWVALIAQCWFEALRSEWVALIVQCEFEALRSDWVALIVQCEFDVLRSN